MKIDFSVQEYFNELIVVQEQYDGEECLYPWVFMTLQMAENKKREILKEGYKGVSIRDVHNVTSKATRKIPRRLREIGGSPDIAIIDNDTIIGCVEIKASYVSLFETQNGIEFPKGRKEILNGNDKRVWEYQNIKGEGNQIMSHLEKFRKVIHTNGLKFLYFSLNEKENKKYIEVKELADLSVAYEKFKADSCLPSTILEAVSEWKRLLEGLVAIDWHKQPLIMDFTDESFKIELLEK